MARTITAAMAANVAEKSTRPVLVVDLYFSGALQRLSCNGPITFDSNSYADSGLAVNSIDMDGGGAVLKLPMTLERSYQLLNNFWRDQPCTIWYIPGLPDDADDTYTLAEGYKVFDGIIDNCSADGRMITLNCAVGGLRNKTLRHKFNDCCTILLKPGAVLNWGETDVDETAPESVLREASESVTSPIRQEGDGSLSTGPGGAGAFPIDNNIGGTVDPSVSTDADMWRYY